MTRNLSKFILTVGSGFARTVYSILASVCLSARISELGFFINAGFITSVISDCASTKTKVWVFSQENYTFLWTLSK